MEAIIDKIIKVLEIRAGEYFNPQLKKEVNSIIEIIRDIEQEADFEEVSRQLMKHLGNPQLYHPHFTVIVSNARAELVEGKKSVGYVPDYVPD